VVVVVMKMGCRMVDVTRKEIVFCLAVIGDVSRLWRLIWTGYVAEMRKEERM